MSINVLAQSNTFPLTGKVGIGTTTPGVQLQVVGQADIGENTNGTAIIDAYNGDAYFGNNSATNGIAINPSGFVGIGTTSPLGALDVNGSVYLKGISALDQSLVLTPADGTYVIASGSRLKGEYILSWSESANRVQTVHLLVNANQYDALSTLEVLDNHSYYGATVMSNFRLLLSANGSTVYLVVTVGNRNPGTYGGSGVSVQWHGAPGYVAAFGGNLAGTEVATGVAGLVVSEGNIGVGTTSTGAKLEVNGNVKLTTGSGASMTFQDGSVQTVAWNGILSGGDYAESVDVAGDRNNYEPGDVLVIDPSQDGHVAKSFEAYSTSVTGIYSTKPGALGRRQHSDASHIKDEVPMAMIGVVPTKVTTANGTIRPGDLLVTSSIPGYAMKGTDRTKLTGAIVGKSMGHLDSGTGLIEVAVSLQ